MMTSTRLESMNTRRNKMVLAQFGNKFMHISVSQFHSLRYTLRHEKITRLVLQ
jgi:hypothetical protein